MRTILALLLTGLVLAAPLAIADGAGRSDEGKTRADEARGNATASRDDHHDDGERDNRTARHAARAEAAANRTASFDSLMTRLETLRLSWTENTTRIREECRADFDAANASKEDRRAHAHCIRDGYAGWRAEHRQDLRDLREDLRALLSGRGRGHLEN